MLIAAYKVKGGEKEKGKEWETQGITGLPTFQDRSPLMGTVRHWGNLPMLSNP